jgi:hypothetical protein
MITGRQNSSQFAEATKWPHLAQAASRGAVAQRSLGRGSEGIQVIASDSLGVVHRASSQADGTSAIMSLAPITLRTASMDAGSDVSLAVVPREPARFAALQNACRRNAVGPPPK